MSANHPQSYQPNIQAPRFTPNQYTQDGGYAPAHPQGQAIYQTQGGPPGVVQNQQSSQTNPAQSLSNQQNQARLTPMTQPTAPPTPPNQQQQQQSQQQPQYTVQMAPQGLQTGGSGNGNPRPQFRPQSQVQRGPARQQPQLNQQYIYGQQLNGVQYALPFVFPTGHVRAPTYSYYVPQPYNNYAPAPQGYQQMPAVSSNGQQRQSTPQAAVQTMPPTQTNEFSGYPGMEVYQPSMQAPAAPAQQPPPQPQQKTVKKPGNKAITIINPNTGKSIFEDDSTAAGANSGGSTTSIATVDKAITASHNELSKDEAVEKDSLSTTTAEPSTPVVSAMSDGPSVDITPKHQINKSKKVKPPEPLSVLPTQQPPQQPPATSVPVISSEPQPIKSLKTEPEPEPIIAPVQKDNENNNVAPVSTLPIVPVAVSPEPVAKVEPVKVVSVAAPYDVNDTNNNNYQKAEQTLPESKEKVAKEVTPPPPAATEVDQDTNNNSTDDKSVMTSPSIRQNASPVPTPEVEEKSAPSRKISIIDYVAGQWSPENTAGKKYYTRDQMLKLKDLPIAALTPQLRVSETVAHTLMKNNKETLTNTLNQTMPLPNMTGGGSSGMQRGQFDAINSLTPKFMTQQMGGRNPYQKRPSQQGNKQQVPSSGRGSQAGIIKLTLSLQDDVKLNEAENAWKPSHLVKKQDMTEEERVTDDLLSRFRSMLNKLTAENFNLLVEQVKTYKIDTSERLDGVISLVFEKAISEPKFAPTYANLCKEVAFITTAGQGDGPQAKKNTLKVKLITQCQKEFERHKEESKVFNDIEDKLREIENLQDPAQREEEKARLEEKHYRVRQRANGTVKFIGELYKIDMLTSKIMRTCIELLLQEITEEKVERVCKLLQTIGAKMEKADGRQSLDTYFQKLSQMLHPSHKIIKSSRIKFEIQNLEDLRNNNWKSRRIEATPKSFEQIQQETDHEQQVINYQTRQNAKDDRQRGHQGGYNRRQQQDSDGWQTQQNNKSRVQPMQFNKITIPTANAELPKFGNPTDFQKFMPLGNKFSGLQVDAEADVRFGGSGGGSKNSSMERDRGGSRYYNNNGDNRDNRDNRNDGRNYSGRNSGSNQGSRNSSQIRSRDNSGGPGGPSRSLQAPRHHQQPQIVSNMSFSGIVKQPVKPPLAAAPAEPMSREDVDKNYKEMLNIVNAYRDDKLTLESAVDNLKPLNINKDVLVEIYNKYLDRKDIDRENLMMLLCELMKNQKLSRDDNVSALIETMELAPDMMCDVPRVHEYIAQFLAELIIAKVLTFQEVLTICEADMKTTEGFGEKMLCFIFNAVGKRHVAGTLHEIVNASNCDLGSFTTDGNFKRWLEANKFTAAVQQATRGSNDVIKSVKQLLEQEKVAGEVIVDHINSTKCTIDKTFIRDLTKAIIENCCEDNPGQQACKVQNNRLVILALVLQRCIDNKRDLELECINAIHSFADEREYPPGLLNTIFDILYDNDALSMEAFEEWKNDPLGKGKGVAICSTRQFFTKLAEENDDEGDYQEEADS